MKSNLIHALLATVLLASCSQEEVIQEVDTSQSAIGFSTFVDKATRATTTTTDNLSTFKVWGTKFREGNEESVRIMDGTDVTKSGNYWIYSPTKFWVNGNAYSFTAIGSSDGDITNYYTYTAPDVSTIVYNTYLTHYMGTLAYNNKVPNGGADLIWASNKVPPIAERENGPSSVTFSFGHLLSRVNLKFVNKRTIASPDVTLKNVKIASASTGTLDFSKYNVGVPSTEFKWNFSSDNFDCVFNFNSNSAEYYLSATAGINEVTTNDQFLIPSQKTITVSFDCYTSITTEGNASNHINISKTITFGDDGTPSPFKNLELKPGYSYTLVAYLTDELDNSGTINFEVKVDDYVDTSKPIITFKDVNPLTTSADANPNEAIVTTLGVKNIYAASDLVYYGGSDSEQGFAEINYSDYTYKWSIENNDNFSFVSSGNLNSNNIYSYVPNNNSHPTYFDVDFYCKRNYSPNGKTERNDGFIDVTFTVYKNEKKVVSRTLSVPIKYYEKDDLPTGGSQDGDDNDG